MKLYFGNNFPVSQWILIRFCTNLAYVKMPHPLKCDSLLLSVQNEDLIGVGLHLSHHITHILWPYILLNRIWLDIASHVQMLIAYAKFAEA